MVEVRFDDSPSQATARAIMGKNFLGIPEVHKAFGVTLTPEELKEVEVISFGGKALGLAELEPLKETHVLFLGVSRDGQGKPLTINRLRELFPRTGQPRFAPYDWFAKEEFATKPTPRLRWYLMRKEILPESMGKTWREQERLLKPDEERPLAVEVTYLAFFYYLINRERLFEHDYVWCRDRDPVGKYAFVGLFTPEGFNVYYTWPQNAFPRLGLIPSRR